MFLSLAAAGTNAHAVIPPPDGGYPGFTTAEGTKALQNLTTGAANTGVGWYSLFTTSSGSYNTGVGAGTLALNTGDQNTATGTAAMLLNTSGAANTATGAFALFSNTANGGNTATGARALFSNTGSYNMANGSYALESNTTGSGNVANGSQTLRENNTGSNNTASGFLALYHNTADGNTASGYGALSANTTGQNNTANGIRALEVNTTGNANLAEGVFALFRNTSGSQNTAIGAAALANNTTGVRNVALGDNAGVGVTTANNVIAIGVAGENVDNTCYIDNIFGVISTAGTGVFVNSEGKLGTGTSSRRFKDGIKPMDQTSEVILALKPVTFSYKKEIDPAGRSQFGLVAEEVEKVSADLVVRDKEGKPYSVRYDQVNAMLLNEFLKEHRTVLELKEQIAALIATVKEQSVQIQKVSAELETSKNARQVAQVR